MNFLAYLPSIVSVAHFGTVVEEHANGLVRKLKGHAKFICKIDPLPKNERDLLRILSKN